MADEVSDDVQEIMIRSRIAWNNRRHTIAGLARVEGIHDASLARSMGMSRQKLSNRLSGQNTIPPWELDGFSVVLGVERAVLDMEPAEALRWVAAHKPELIMATRSRCFAVSGLIAAA